MRLKDEKESASLEQMFNDTVSDLRMLTDEMGEWRDNMSGTSLEATSKYERVEECADVLDSACNDLEEVNLEELPPEVKDKVISVTYKMPRRNAGRAWRAGAIATKLSAISESINDWVKVANAPTIILTMSADSPAVVNTETVKEPVDTSEAEQIADTISNQADELSGLDFPGMYG